MIKLGVPQSSILGPILFLLYINDLPAGRNKKATQVLFADDTSVLFTHCNIMEFHVNIDTVFGNVNNWFKKKCLSLNIENTQYIHFKTRKSQTININMCLDNNRISNSLYTKFFGLIADNTLSWKPHIEHL